MKCPDSAKFRLLLDGKLSSEEFRPIEAHVEECANCQALLGRLLTEGKAQAAPGSDTRSRLVGPTR